MAKKKFNDQTIKEIKDKIKAIVDTGDDAIITIEASRKQVEEVEL